MILYLNRRSFIRTDHGIDISIPLHNGNNPVLAWNCDPIKLEPVMTGRFIGDVHQGGAINFRDLFMNPHANGTHTECVGHISKEFITINKCLKQFHFYANLVSVQPRKIDNPEYNQEDEIIERSTLEEVCEPNVEQIRESEVLIIRTLPNTDSKLSHNYSNTNPVYFSKDAIEYINDLSIVHLMVDLPSIDREEDKGELIGHHEFWNYPENPQVHKTITELIYVPTNVKDGYYFCNIQITSLENDASPSKIILFEIES